MDVPVYMEQPEGFFQGYHNKVICLLNKSLYGSKQGGRQWNKQLHEGLTQLNFTRTYSDTSLYVYHHEDIKIIMPVFVSDMTLASKLEPALENFITELAKHFKLHDLGPTDQLLGIKIDHDHSLRSISQSQCQYMLETIQHFSMENFKTVSTPMELGLCLSKDMSPKGDEERTYMKNIPYCEAIGLVMYLTTTTQPDITYAAGALARFGSNPGIGHWNAVKHLLHYLQGTVNHTLTYSPDHTSGKNFHDFSDADHGRCKDSGWSTGRYIVKIGTRAISWSSKLQGIIPLASTEVEYFATAEASKEICWM